MRTACRIGIVAGLLLGCCMAQGEEAGSDAFGDPLPEHVVMRLGTIRFRQPEYAVQVAFSPDGKRLASVARDGKLRIWEVPSGKPVVRTPGRQFNGFDMEALAYSADGKLIAAATRSSLQLLDASTGAVIRNVGSPIYPCGLALSADGAVLAATPLSERVYAWDTSNGKRLLDVKAYKLNERPSLTLSPDGTRLWTFTRDGGARLWNLETGKEDQPAWQEMQESVTGAFSDDGRRLALAGAKRGVRVYEEGHEPVELGKLDGGVATLVFLEDEDTLAAVGRGGVLARWSLTTRARQSDVALQHFPPLKDESYRPGIAISRDGRHVARPGVAVHLWDAATGELLSPVEGGTQRPCGLALSPDEAYVATGNGDGTIHMWSLATGTCVGKLAVDKEYAYPVGFSATGEALIVRTYEGSIVLLRVPDLALLRSFEDAGRGGIGLLDGGRMAIVGPAWEDGLALMDLRDGSITTRPGGERVEGFEGVVVSPDQTLVACTWTSHDIKHRPPICVHSVPTGRQLCVLSAGLGWQDSFEFSQDSAYVIVRGWDGKTTRWSVATGEQESEEEGGFEGLDLEGEPRAEVTLELSEEGVLAVRRIGESEVVWKVDPACGEFCGSAMTADGRRLITAMDDTTLLVWELPGRAVAPPPMLDEPMEGVWEMLGSSNTWDVSCASATLVARGDEAVAFLRGRLSHPTPDPVVPDAAFPLTWTREGLARLRGVWALGRIETPAARELLREVASAAEGGREARAARSLIERLR